MEADFRPPRATLSCSTCGLTVQRALPGEDAPASGWLCPDCDPDREAEDEEPHYSGCMQSAALYDFTFDKQHQRIWVPPGYQPCSPYKPVREIPEWVQDREILRKVIFSHPQSDRLGARWSNIVYKYYNLQEPARWIAADLNLKTDYVKSVIKKLSKRASTLAIKEREKIIELSTARKLFEAGYSIRQVASELKLSIGKTHSLKRAA